jgi:hypothetical protein
LMAVVVIFMSYLGGNTVKIIAKMIKPETSD